MPRSLYDNPLLHKFLSQIDSNIKHFGVNRSFADIARRTNRNFIVNLPSSTKKSFKKDPVILICNHPNQLEVFLLIGALPHRPNTFLMAINNLLSIIPSFDKHIIPLFIGYRSASNSKFDWKTALINSIHYSPSFSKEESHKKNINNVKLAAKKVDQNSTVIIFPAGGSKNGRDFYSGVGYLIKNVKKYRQAKIVFAHVTGTSIFDALRFNPHLSKFFPDIKFEFSFPLPLSAFSSQEPKQITAQLQSEYDKWSLPFYTVPKSTSWALYFRSLLFFLLFRGY